MHGVCRAGDDCSYSHDMTAPQETVCQYYLKGTCTYGDQCRYDHIRPSPKQLPGKTPHKPSRKPAPISTTCPQNIGKMVTLKKGVTDSCNDESLLSPLKSPDEWVKAAEFVPGQPYQGSFPSSYAKAAQCGVPTEETRQLIMEPGAYKLLCPFAAQGECRYAETCSYIHGDICDMCGAAVLHPDDNDQREKHMKECMDQHEKDMELSFAVASSQTKACGICMDTVWEKADPVERRFGILSSCNHCFCLSCIRKWRGAKEFHSNIVKACPECRMPSDFVTPSKYWVETKEEKEKLINDYKSALSSKPCRYFDQGRGKCPFRGNCFYLHAYPDGRKPDADEYRPRRGRDSDGNMAILQQMILWEYLEERQERILFELELADELDHILVNLFESDSDSSDYDL